jgi:hypothetical protein
MPLNTQPETRARTRALRGSSHRSHRDEHSGRAMTGLLSLLATGTLVALGIWLLGGIVLRVGGVLLVAGGLLSTAATGSVAAALATLIGGLAWLVGHWLFAARHHFFILPLARRIFLEVLPRSLDPTRRWGIPNVPPERR